jgi:hypothetical protein
VARVRRGERAGGEAQGSHERYSMCELHTCRCPTAPFTGLGRMGRPQRAAILDLFDINCQSFGIDG